MMLLLTWIIGWWLDGGYVYRTDRIKVTSVTPLPDMRLLVVFDNHVVKLFDVRKIISDYPEYAALENEDLFSSVKVEAGGYGISWTSELDVSEGELWENGQELSLDADGNEFSV